MFELLLLVAVVFLVKLIIDSGYKNENYFKNRGIKFKKPYFLIGNSGKILTRQVTNYEFFQDMYSAFPHERISGVFEFRSPIMVVRDPDLVKRLSIQEFEHFTDRRNIIHDDIEITFSKSLFMLRGEEWKKMRSTLSPAFTGSKMRNMFELVSQVTKEMVVFLNKENKEKGHQTYEMKDFCSRMANDIIATCAFGIQVNSLEDQDNEFFVKGKDVTNFTNFFLLLRMILIMRFPKVGKFLGIKMFPDSLIGFFKNVILGAMDYREGNNVVRPDMIHLLMEAKKGKLSHQTLSDKDFAEFATVEESNIGKKEGKKHLSDDDIVSQCFLFFFAGFDTVSAELSFLCYELAVNPEIQERLFEEIRETNLELGQKVLNYDTIQKMKYLDMVVSELLRKWPAIPGMERACTKNFQLDEICKFEKGDSFWIPSVALQHDPQYYPNPLKFDPERFSDENKHKIVPGTYLPFGMGPRNCIGSRFALMEIKAIIYNILLNFRIEPNEKTQIPLKLTKKFQVSSEKGIWVQLIPRCNI